MSYKIEKITPLSIAQTKNLIISHSINEYSKSYEAKALC
jgi:hypothetical protein